MTGSGAHVAGHSVPAGNPAPAGDHPLERSTNGRRRPFVVGRQVRGSSTMWVLTPVAASVPGPWDLAMLVRTP